MNCPYCLDPFDVEIKVPIKLRCSHSFCKECIELLGNVLTYCPIDNFKVEYRLDEINQEILNELNFKCSLHDSNCIGVCFDHCCSLCEDCKKSHSECHIFKGTQKQIANKILELADVAIKNKSLYNQGNNSPSIFHIDEIVELVESHLKTLDGVCDKFEKNLLSQEQKEKFLEDIKPILKIKGDENELLSIEKNSVKPKPPNFDFSDINSLKKMIENMTMNMNIVDEKVNLEFGFINSNFLPYFKQIKTNTEEYGKYFCNFRQTVAEYITVFGCGLGIPSLEGGSIYISCFEITVNEEKYREDIGIIEYIPNRLTSRINFQNPIIFPIDTDMFFQIEIEGTNNFLFKVAESNKVSVMDVDGKHYHGDFPILYLLT